MAIFDIYARFLGCKCWQNSTLTVWYGHLSEMATKIRLKISVTLWRRVFTSNFASPNPSTSLTNEFANSPQKTGGPLYMKRYLFCRLGMPQYNLSIRTHTHVIFMPTEGSYQEHGDWSSKTWRSDLTGLFTSALGPVYCYYSCRSTL